MVGIDAKTLRKHYRHELDHGHTKANAKVAENLYRKATGEGREAVTAAIFWLKARARWKEVSVHEHGGSGGEPFERQRHQAHHRLAARSRGTEKDCRASPSTIRTGRGTRSNDRSVEDLGPLPYASKVEAMAGYGLSAR